MCHLDWGNQKLGRAERKIKNSTLIKEIIGGPEGSLIFRWSIPSAPPTKVKFGWKGKFNLGRPTKRGSKPQNNNRPQRGVSKIRVKKFAGKVD